MVRQSALDPQAGNAHPLSADFEQALVAAARFGAAQAVDATDALAADNFEWLRYEWKLRDVVAALRNAGSLVRAGAELELRFEVEETTLVLTSAEPDEWTGEPEPSTLLRHLEEAGPKLTWALDELLQGDFEDGFAVVQRAEAKAAFSKRRWTEGISDRCVWIGPDVAGLAAWVAGSTPEQIANKLFSQPGALALLARWPSPQPARAGEWLTVGGLGERADRAKDDDLLLARLAERKEESKLPSWRLLRADTHSDLPAELRRPLNRAIGIIAAKLIAVYEDGTLHPDPDQATVWALPDSPGDAESDVDAIVELARWVGADLSESRFTVARDIAARRIPDPLHGGPPEPPLDAARIAYRLAVHADVVESLERQQKLEESFRDLDDKAAEMRASIDDTLDGTVTKTLAGALAIAIAALASAEVRDWPATIAAFVLAGYIGINAVALARWQREDADVRLDEAANLATQRVEKLGDRLKKSTTGWRRQLEIRTRRATAILWVLAILLCLGGLAGNSDIRQFVGLEHKAGPAPQPNNSISLISIW